MFGVVIFRRLVLIATAVTLLSFVRADQLDRRQNPDFITVLPTESSSSIIVAATSIPSDTPPQEPTTPLPASDPVETTGTPSLPTPPSGSDDSAGDLSASVGPIQGPYFGGIPVTNPDIALVCILLNVFFLGAVVHAIEYLQHSRRSKNGSDETLSGVVAAFCLARVATCALRLAWVGSRTSAAIIFLELVTESAGTGLIFLLNYRMARRMIGLYNIRLSLWARSVVDSSMRVVVAVSLAVAFILNTVGLALFIVRSSSGPGPAAAVILVQASATVLLLAGLSFFGAVVLLRTFADHAIIKRRKKMSLTFFIGAGLLTTASQLVRTAATFFIWRPLDASAATILSKTVYYSTSFGVEILTVAFYTAMKIDVLFSKPLPPTWVASQSGKVSETSIAAPTVSGVSTPDIRARDMEDGRHGGWASSTTLGSIHSAVADPPIKNEPDIKVESTRADEVDESGDSEMNRSSKSMSIAIYRSFSVSSARISTPSSLTEPNGSRD